MTIRSPYRRLVGQLRHALVGGPPGDEDHNIWNWYVSTAMVGIIDGGMWVFLPVFLARLGASPGLLGLHSSLPALLSILFLVPAGALVERVRDQLPAMVRLGLVTRVSYLLVILAPFFVPGPYLPLFIVAVWALKTIPDAGAMTLWTSIAGRAVSPRRRAHVNGTRWALLSLTSALSQAVFGRWLDGGPFPGRYQMVFAVSLVAAVADLGFFSRLHIPRLVPEERDAARATLGQRLRAYVQPLAEHRPFVRYLAATFVYRVLLNLPTALFTLLWVRELQASDSLIGLRGSVGYGTLVLGYLVWGRQANRLGHRRVLRLGAVGTACYVICSALVPSAGWLVPVAVLWGATVSGIDVGLFDLMLDACPRGKETRFASVALVAANLGMFAGPLLGVALANATSVRTAMIIAGVLQILATAPFALLPKDV